MDKNQKSKEQLIGELEESNKKTLELERKLSAEVKLNSVIIENAPIGIYYNNFKGIFLYGNKRAEEIIGYKREELIGRNFLELDLIKKNNMPRALKILSMNAIGRSTGPDYFSLKRKDNTHKEVVIYTQVAAYGNEKIVIGLVEDLTKYRYVEKKVIEAEDFLNNIINTIPDIFYVFRPNGKFVIWNKAFREITEYSDDEISKMKPTDFFPKEEIPRMALAISIAFIKGFNTDDSELVTKSGKRIPYSFSGSLMRDSDGNPILCGIGKDVSHLKETQSKLNEKMHALEIFNKASIGRELKMVELKSKISKLEKKLQEKTIN